MRAQLRCFLLQGVPVRPQGIYELAEGRLHRRRDELGARCRHFLSASRTDRHEHKAQRHQLPASSATGSTISHRPRGHTGTHGHSASFPLSPSAVQIATFCDGAAASNVAWAAPSTFVRCWADNWIRTTET